mmetsp:Transcript_19142/g.49424  ORF Transcript_19142/g.49424 Transcript_19142/m.49424 type:complete len:122 (+) Transcript_19142:34-399(+)
MGVYHCECGETLRGESFSCEDCGFGEGDGTILCEDCAECHCDQPADKDATMMKNDLGLISHMLDLGVYTGNSKHDREKTIQSETLRGMLKCLVADPTGFKERFDELEADGAGASKRLRAGR